MSSLASQSCVPCRGDTPAIQGSQLRALHAQVPEWAVIDEHRLRRNFRFPDFKQALDFVNRVGAVAERQGHHPDIVLAWGKAEITMWTHAIHGLSESDFIMAAKIDQLVHRKIFRREARRDQRTDNQTDGSGLITGACFFHRRIANAQAPTGTSMASPVKSATACGAIPRSIANPVR